MEESFVIKNKFTWVKYINMFSVSSSEGLNLHKSTWSSVKVGEKGGRKEQTYLREGGKEGRREEDKEERKE